MPGYIMRLKDNYGIDDFREYITDALRWCESTDDPMFDGDGHGRYADINVQRMYILWSDGHEFGYESGLAESATLN